MVSRPPALLLAFVLSQALVGYVNGAASDVFNVKLDGKGSCAGQPYETWFSDSVKLADAASTGYKATDASSRKYLTTFFSIGPKDSTDKVKEYIDSVVTGLKGEGLPGGKPWLFCSSEWAEQKKWDDVALDKRTGEAVRGNKKIEEIYKREVKDGVVPFWSSDLKQYFFAPPGDYCSNPGYLGATQDTTTPSTLSLCVDKFDKSEGSTLANVPAVTKSRVSVNTLKVHSLTLFHELFHLANGVSRTPDADTETIKQLVDLDSETAEINPESYALFGFAYYLGQQSTEYTFETSQSKKKAAPKEGEPAKRMAEDFSGARRLFRKGRLSRKF